MKTVNIYSVSCHFRPVFLTLFHFLLFCDCCHFASTWSNTLRCWLSVCYLRAELNQKVTSSFLICLRFNRALLSKKPDFRSMSRLEIRRNLGLMRLHRRGGRLESCKTRKVRAHASSYCAKINKLREMQASRPIGY